MVLSHDLSAVDSSATLHHLPRAWVHTQYMLTHMQNRNTSVTGAVPTVTCRVIVTEAHMDRCTHIHRIPGDICTALLADVGGALRPKEILPCCTAGEARSSRLPGLGGPLRPSHPFCVRGPTHFLSPTPSLCPAEPKEGMAQRGEPRPARAGVGAAGAQEPAPDARSRSGLGLRVRQRRAGGGLGA